MRILNCRKFVLSQDEKMSYSSVGCVDLQEKLKLFLQEQQSGTLPSHVMRRKIELHTTPVKLSPIHQDSNLRFGSKIMLYNEKSKSFVCTDVDNKIHHFNQRFQVSASQLAQPIIRACFIVERVPSKLDPLYVKQGEEDILHYGQTLRFVLCTELSETPLYLRTEASTPNCHAPRSKRQEVSIDENLDYSTVWKLEYIDPGFKIEMEGEKVKANSPLLVRHCQTNECLIVDSQFLVLNDFGKEAEVSCGKVVDVHKLQKPECFFSLVGESNEACNDE